MQVELLLSFIQKTNIKFWQPGRDITINESILRYIGRAKEITTVPNKPMLTGLKI
jgi:hypothetical protein